MAAVLFLNGPLRLETKTGDDVTPGGQVRKAILAVVATAPRGMCSRGRLIEMFWAESPPEKAHSSLRTALSKLRKELGTLAPGLLHIDSQCVSLDLARLRLDRGSEGEFLEGIDIGGDGAEGFEDWLRAERSAAEDMRSDLGEAASFRPPVVAFVRGDGPQDPAANRVLDAIGRQLAEWAGALIIDETRDGPLADQPSPFLLVQIVTRSRGEGSDMALRVLRASDEHILWSEWLSLPAGGDPLRDATVAEFCGRTAERLARAVSGAGEAASPYHLLRTMFRLDDRAADDAESLLVSQRDRFPGTQADALLSYLETLRHGETWSKRSVPHEGSASATLRRVLDDDTATGLTLAAAAYAAHYLEGQSDLALDTLQIATDISPWQAFCWDHLALVRFHCGDVDGARQAADRAVALSPMSPLRHAYASTRAMTAFAEADFETTVRLGSVALGRAPTFGSALRYTASGLGLLGRHEDAAQLTARIRSYAPEFEPELVEAGEFRTANRSTAQLLAEGLRSAQAAWR